MGFADYVTRLSKNDEWYTPRHAVEVVLPYVPAGATIWCPFDTAASEFVQVFTKRGFNVIATHIATGQDFFDYEPEQYDCIISNPPYSKKDAVYERLMCLGRPWAMLMGMNGLFDSKRRFTLFKENGVQLLIPDGRTKFVNRDNGELVSPPFQAVYVCWRFLPETICFERDPVMDGNDLWRCA